MEIISQPAIPLMVWALSLVDQHDVYQDHPLVLHHPVVVPVLALHLQGFPLLVLQVHLLHSVEIIQAVILLTVLIIHLFQHANKVNVLYVKVMEVLFVVCLVESHVAVMQPALQILQAL